MHDELGQYGLWWLPNKTMIMEISLSPGAQLARLLSVSFTRLIGMAALAGAMTACQTAPQSPPGYVVRSPAEQGLLTPYTLTLRYFSDREALTMLQAMAEEFPGYRSHNLIAKSASVRDYEYLSTAKAVKLEEWLYRLLWYLGFDTERDVLIQIDGIHVIVDKLVPGPSRPAANERRRFS